MDLIGISLQEHFQFLGVGVLLVLISSWIVWKQGFFHCPKSLVGLARLTLWDLLGVFSVFLVMVLFVAPSIAMLVLSWEAGEILDFHDIALDPLMQAWLNVIGIILSASAVFIFCRCRVPEVRRVIWGASTFQGGERCIHDMFIGAVTWLISYPWLIIIGQVVAIVALLLWQQEPVHEDQVAVKFFKMTLTHPFLLITTMILLVVVVPVMEELLFRGFLQTWLKQKWGRTKAIVLTSLTFSAFHFSATQGLNNIELLISLFVLSCFLGFLYERQESLLAPITLHATFNAVSILAILL